MHRPPNPPPSFPPSTTSSTPANSFSSASGTSTSSIPQITLSGSAQDGNESQNEIGASDKVDYGPMVVVERGELAGKRARFSLVVAQQPIHGRRMTEKDRRPLAHSPILRLRIMECRRIGMSAEFDEEEIDVNAFEPGHFMCAADIYPSPNPDTQLVPSRSDPPPIQTPRPDATPTPPHADAKSGGLVMADKTSRRVGAWTGDAHPGPLIPLLPAPPGSSEQTPSSGGNTPQGSTHSSQTARPVPSPPSRTAGVQRTAGERSSSGCADGDTPPHAPKKTRQQTASRNLYGSLHVPAIRVIAPDGAMGLWFLFTDLSVRYEGTYALRFRVFDITAINPSSGARAPFLVETQSQIFRVYSPRNFPGLPKPTALAEHFARQGFKLNTRKNERQARSPPPYPSSRFPVPPSTSHTSESPEGPVRPEAQPLQSGHAPTSTHEPRR